MDLHLAHTEFSNHAAQQLFQPLKAFNWLIKPPF